MVYPQYTEYTVRLARICVLTSLTGWIVLFPVREGEQGETEGRRVVRYPDAHQLFVGNVPHDVDKTELKEFFERKSTLMIQQWRINDTGYIKMRGLSHVKFFKIFIDFEQGKVF